MNFNQIYSPRMSADLSFIKISVIVELNDNMTTVRMYVFRTFPKAQSAKGETALKENEK